MASSYSLSPYDNVGSGITRSGAMKFPNPFFDIASEFIPSEINQVFEWCHVPGNAYIALNRYSSMLVEQLKEGNHVLGTDNVSHIVEKVGVREIDEKIIVLKVKGMNAELRITKEHPVKLANGSYVEAGKLTLRDCVQCMDGCIRPIESLEKVKYTGPVYSITVEGSASYYANDIAVHNCTPAGTMVDIDAYGRVKAVETITVGEPVLSADGNTYPVERTGSRQIDEDIMRIVAGGVKGQDLLITKDHPLLIWRPKSTLKPNRLNFNKADIEKKYIKAGELRKGDWVCRPRPVFEETTRDFPFSPFIVGMYISEGCLIKRDLTDGLRHARGVQFTIGSHETELKNKLMQELQDYCGCEAVAYTSKDRPDIIQVRIFDPELAVWLQTNIGELCRNKRLPAIIFHLPMEMRMELLGTWIDGDGHVRSDTRLARKHVSALILSSCSFELLYQASVLAQSCGLNPSICRRNCATPGGFSEAQDITQLIFNVEDTRALAPYILKAAGRAVSEEPGRGNNVYAAGATIWKKVESVTTEHYTGTVYSLKVISSHNYLMNSVLGHNCEYLYLSMGTYRSASRRVCRYFLTEIDITGESEEERDNIDELLNRKLHLMTELAQIGDDFMTYGNVFVSIYFPFERFLICPECKTEYSINHIAYKFKADKTAFLCKCLKCSYSGEFRCDDRRSPAKEDIKLIRWNPKQVRLRVHPVSGDIEYYWEMPPRFVERITAGDEFFVRSTPMTILKCLSSQAQKSSEGMALFKFKKESIYHFRESTLAGLPIVGWGIPPIMPNFKLAYYIQVLRRYDEAIAMDFIIPFRILHPTVGAAPQQDAILSSNLAEFRGHMLRMVSERRRDPTNVQVAPFPIGYQMIGGEARMIAPKESIKFAVEELLNALGYPAELYMGSLNLQSAPVALRLFEKSQGSLVDGYNDLVSWIVTRIARQYMMGEIDASLRSVTLADDLERKALQLQAAAGQDVAKSTAYSPFGLDFLDEQKKIIDEQKAVAKLQTDAQNEQQAAEAQAQGSGMGGGQAEESGGAGQGTPGDLNSQSEQLANDMLFNMPESLRRSQLIKIKQSNPTLHALVIQKMDEKRNAQRAQGGAQVMQSNQQAVAQGQPPSV